MALDPPPSEDTFDATTLAHNCNRLDDRDLPKPFFDSVVGEVIAAGLGREHSGTGGAPIDGFA